MGLRILSLFFRTFAGDLGTRSAINGVSPHGVHPWEPGAYNNEYKKERRWIVHRPGPKWNGYYEEVGAGFSTLRIADTGSGRHWIRFPDGDDQRFAAFKFNTDFSILSEMRADSLAWEGDDFFSRIWAG